MTPIDPILHELADEQRELSAPAGVERALMAEFRKRHKRSWMPWLGFAAASAACGALAFYVLQPPPAETLALHAEAPKAPEVKFTPKPVLKARVAVARVATAPPRKAMTPPAVPEIATDFFPLRAGPVLAPGEMAQVVRTRIPRRELRRFGLAQSDFYSTIGARPDIRADVVFGYDGTARAIRFIHDSQ